MYGPILRRIVDLFSFKSQGATVRWEIGDNIVFHSCNFYLY
jgi:hypothetical protein